MLLRWFLASLHLLVLPLGLSAVWLRGRALRRTRDAVDLPSVFVADNLWGIAALLWIVTGLARLLGGFEKATSYYLHDSMFQLKMGVFLVIFLLEIWPMATLIRWRLALHRGQVPNLAAAGTFGWISFVETGLLIVMVVAATAVARGFLY